MEKISVVDLGQIGEPAAGIVNNFIDKISGALEWMVSPRNIKPAIIEANKSIIEEISNRQDINPIERAAIVSNYKKIVKEYKNQVDVMRLAVEHLNPNAEPEKVSDDWITFFFEKVKNVNDEYMKMIWGKILAGEFNKPNTYTKQLLHTMSIMDSSIANSFQKIRSSFFYSEPLLYAFIYRSNSKNIKNIQKYQKKEIDISDFRELDNIGLIEYRPSFYLLNIQNKEFNYGKYKIKLNTTERSIYTGNVSLTNIGKQLCNISPMIYDEDILNICIDAWKKLEYNPVVEVIEDGSD